MNVTDQEVASIIVDYFNKCIKSNKLNQDNIDSLNVAIDCITDVFNIDRDFVSNVVNTAYRGNDLLGYLPNGKRSSLNLDKVNSYSVTSEETKSPKTDEVEKSDNIVNEVSDTDLKKAEAFKEKGNQFMKSKKFPSAIDSYSEAIKLNPVNLNYYNNRSLAYFKESNFNEAVKDANEAIALDSKTAPSNFKAYYRLGLAKYALGEYEESLTALKKMIEIAQNNKKETEITKQMDNDYEKAKEKVQELFFSQITKSNGVQSSSEDTPKRRVTLNDIFNMAGNNLNMIMSNPLFKEVVEQLIAKNPEAKQQFENLMNDPRVKEMKNNVRADSLSNFPMLKEMFYSLLNTTVYEENVNK